MAEAGWGCSGSQSRPGYWGCERGRADGASTAGDTVRTRDRARVRLGAWSASGNYHPVLTRVQCVLTSVHSPNSGRVVPIRVMEVIWSE